VSSRGILPGGGLGAAGGVGGGVGRPGGDEDAKGGCSAHGYLADSFHGAVSPCSCWDASASDWASADWASQRDWLMDSQAVRGSPEYWSAPSTGTVGPDEVPGAA